MRKTDCGLVSSLRVSNPQTARDLPAATLICISRTVWEHIRDKLPYSGKVRRRQGGLVAASRQTDLKARTGVPQRGQENAFIGVGPATDAGEHLALGVRALPANTPPAEIAFVDIRPEAPRDLPDARGIRRAVGRGRGRGRCLVEARGVAVERIAVAER